MTTPAAPENSPDRQQTISGEIEAQREAIKRAKGKIETKFKELRKKIGTPEAGFDESVVLMALQNPLDKLQKEIEEEVISKNGKPLDTNKLTNFGEKIREAVELAQTYLDKITAETGGITPEVLVKMTRDINKRASRIMDLFASGENRDLLIAFRAAIGSTNAESDLPTEEKKAKETVLKYLNSEFEQNSKLMTYVWSVLAFMKKEDRLEVAKNYCQKKSPEQIEEFLRKGNEMGAFSFDEMQEVNSGKKYSKDEQEKAFTNWKTQNDYRVEAAKLSIIPYGTENAAGKMLTISNLLLGFVKFGCGVSIVGNFVTGAWSGGKFKGFGEGIKRLTNAPSLVAASVYTAIKIGESKSNLTEILQGKKPEREAKQALLREKKGNAQFPEWDAFFKLQDFAGTTVFFDYIQYLKNFHKETDISRLYNHLTTAKFSEFLGMMANNPKEGKNFDYAKLKKSFDTIKAPEIMTFAKIFDALNIGRVNAKDQYTQALREDSAVS